MEHTYENQTTYGALAYETMFGYYADDLDDLPYQLDLDNMRGPGGEFCTELGVALERCVENGRRITVRDYVDALCLENGRYSSLGIECDDYGEFMRRVRMVDVVF